MPHLVRFYNFSRRLATDFLKEMKTGVSATVSHLESRNAAASGSSDSTGLLINGLEDARVPRGCQRIRGTLTPGPPARAALQGGHPSLCSQPGMHRDQQVTKQLLPALARRGRVCRAQLAGAAGGRSPNARPAVRSCEPGAGPQPRPARAAGSAARAACPPSARPPSPAPGQLCSA